MVKLEVITKSGTKLLKKSPSKKKKINKNQNNQLSLVVSKSINKPKVSNNKSKSTVMSGSDFVSTVKLFGTNDLDGEIAVVFKYDIAPHTFPGTRLELLSNAYQFYKFSKFVVSYKPNIPSSINARYIAYFDTDPDDVQQFSTIDDVLRVAKAHQQSADGKANAPWKVSLPIKNDKTDYFTLPKNDRRFTTQAVLYVIQVGQAINFEGAAIKESMMSGALTVDWTVKLSNPQMNSMNRISDGQSQKDMIRTFKQLALYRRFDLTVGAGNQIGLSKYRLGSYTIDPTMFPGPGSYLVQKVPLRISLPNTLKSINTYSPSKFESNKNRQLGIADLFNLGSITNSEIVTWIEKTWKTFEGGIEVAVTVFDVISSVLALFSDSQITGTQVDIDYDLSSDNTRYLPIGYTVVHYSGGDKGPVLEEIFEFKDPAHAADTSVDVDYQSVLLFYKLEANLNPNESFALPNLPKRL
jgi:hypothetical protein